MVLRGADDDLWRAGGASCPAFCFNKEGSQLPDLCVMCEGNRSFLRSSLVGRIQPVGGQTRVREACPAGAH